MELKSYHTLSFMHSPFLINSVPFSRIQLFHFIIASQCLEEGVSGGSSEVTFPICLCKTFMNPPHSFSLLDSLSDFIYTSSK